MKGKTACEADKESDDLLEKMNLADKKDSMANTLSGGMQRKLCLGMALVGGSKVSVQTLFTVYSVLRIFFEIFLLTLKITIPDKDLTIERCVKLYCTVLD